MYIEIHLAVCDTYMKVTKKIGNKSLIIKSHRPSITVGILLVMGKFWSSMAFVAIANGA